MVLNNLIVQIQGLSGAEGDLSNLLNILNQAEPTIRAAASVILESVARLDFATHTLGCLFLL
jgi:hypothetical protein